MYCPKCGVALSSELKYCKNCGERLFPELDKDGTPGKMLDNILTTLFLIVMFGLGILIGLVAVLLANGIEPRFVVLISLAYLAAVFGICFTLLSQVPKLIDARLNSRSTATAFDQVSPVELPAANTAQLESFQTPASVTEQTTRTLEAGKLLRKK